MCGRYTLIKLSDFTDMFPWIRPPEQDLQPRYNIAPSTLCPVVRSCGSGYLPRALDERGGSRRGCRAALSTEWKSVTFGRVVFGAAVGLG